MDYHWMYQKGGVRAAEHIPAICWPGQICWKQHRTGQMPNISCTQNSALPVPRGILLFCHCFSLLLDVRLHAVSWRKLVQP